MKLIKKLCLLPCMLVAGVCIAQTAETTPTAAPEPSSTVAQAGPSAPAAANVPAPVEPTAPAPSSAVAQPTPSAPAPASVSAPAAPAAPEIYTAPAQAAPSAPVASTQSTTVAATTTAAPTSSTTNFLSSGINMELPEDWTSNLYTMIGLGYMMSGDFDGFALNCRLGYSLAGEGRHNIELEIDIISESASAIYDQNVTPWGECTCPAIGTCGLTSCGQVMTPGSTTPTSNVNVVNTRTKVDFNQIPIFLNYRYIGGFGNLIKGLNWYGGIGVGADFVFTRAYSTGTTFNTCCPEGYLNPNNTYTYKVSTSDIDLIGQGFLGLAYAFTESFSLTGGARLMGLKKYSFGAVNMQAANNGVASNPPMLTPTVNTDNIHWEIELACLWRF